MAKSSTTPTETPTDKAPRAPRKRIDPNVKALANAFRSLAACYAEAARALVEGDSKAAADAVELANSYTGLVGKLSGRVALADATERADATDE